MKMMTEGEYDIAIARLYEILDMDPEPPRGSAEDNELMQLSDRIEEYERLTLPPPFGENTNARDQ
jgi:hypothetical protein